MTRDAHDPTCCAWCSKAGTPCQPGDVAFRATADAHETARARDARAKAGHPIEWFVYDETQTFTREHLTEALHVYLAPANPRPGDVVQYLGHATTQARDAAWMLGALDGTGEPRDRTHDDQETDTMTDHRAEADDYISESYLTTGERATVHALLAIHDTLKVLAGNSAEQHATLAEIRDRLPERVEVKVAPFDPDVIAANLEAIKHEAETPMRGHGECCEPLTEPSVNVTETPDLSTEDAGESSEPAPGMTRCDTCGTERPLNAICPGCEPAPADVDPDEALGALIWDRIWGTTWGIASEDNHDAYRALASTAREHIEAERDVRREVEQEAMQGQIEALEINATLSQRRADKAEADLARVTEERDSLRHVLGEERKIARAVESARDEWRNRHDALRADVEGDRKGWGRAGSDSFTGRFIAHAMGCILTRDNERAES